MAIKNENEFPLCKKCDFAEIDFEIRKNSIQCAGCQFNYVLNGLKSETLNPMQKILLPFIRFLNKIMKKTDNWIRRNYDSKKL
jgi:hypothetical protein